jgi:hypothetical protein
VPVYLEDHPPARRQYRDSRFNSVTVIGLHTAENHPDLVLPDEGAEGVARFIANRTDAAGSYHTVVDSDSKVRVGRYDWTMFHIRDFNSRSLGLSIACRAEQWPTLPDDWVEGALRQAAAEAASMCEWVAARYGWPIPTRRLTRGEALAGVRGFVYHATMDPSRRSDPGSGFPLDRFGRYYLEECSRRGFDPNDGTSNGGSMATRDERIREATLKIQGVVESWGHDLGPTGKDGDPGPITLEAAAATFDQMQQLLNERQNVMAERLTQIGDLEAALAACRAQPGSDERTLALAEIGGQAVDLLRNLRDFR